MNVNQKGVKGLIKVIDDLCDKDYYSFCAFDDHSPIDLIVSDDNGKLFRLQIKYRSKLPQFSDNRYQLHGSSVVNGKRVPINREMIDGWGIYLKEDNQVIYVPIEFMDNKNTLRISIHSNNKDILLW